MVDSRNSFGSTGSASALPGEAAMLPKAQNAIEANAQLAANFVVLFIVKAPLKINYKARTRWENRALKYALTRNRREVCRIGHDLYNA